MRTQPELTAVDLFCGCGGLSEGLRLAGVAIRAGVDFDPKYIASFQHNFPEALAVIADVSQATPQQLCAQMGLLPGSVDLLVGGPPCQGFSKNVPRKYRWLDDPKNAMVRHFLDMAEYLTPAVIVMENVAEMRNGFEGQYTDEVTERLGNLGYEIQHFSLNAANYGVPQRRRRAFFVANRLGQTLRQPEVTHAQSCVGEGDLFSGRIAGHVSVWEAISDLPPLASGEGAPDLDYPTSQMSKYQDWARQKSDSIKNHIARKLQPLQQQRISALLPGQGLKDLPDHLKTKGGYSGAYGRLTKEMIAPTITRWVFHPGSGRWGHPVDERILTIREAARIQGFPDHFEFVGTYNDQAGQVGNAVPPLLAKVVITSILDQLGRADIRRARSSKESFCDFDGSLNAAA